MGFGNNNGQRRGRNSDDNFEQSELWVNVGYTGPNSKGEETFVSLPMGIPLSTMRKQKLGSSPDFNEMAGAKNELMDKLRAIGEELEPGEEKTLSLQVQLRRRNKVENPPEEQNSLIASLNALSLVAKVA